MGVGGFFLLVVIIVVIAVIVLLAAGPALGLYNRKTSPKGDRIEGDGDADRPVERRVENEDQNVQSAPPND